MSWFLSPFLPFGHPSNPTQVANSIILILHVSCYLLGPCSHQQEWLSPSDKSCSSPKTQIKNQVLLLL